MPYRIGFVMEQTLGHVTHAQNFQQWLAQDRDVTPSWIPVYFDMPDRWARTPVVRSNWTLRASLRAKAQIRTVLRSERLDGLFFHTQVAALFAGSFMAKIPTVISMDATPLNFDEIGRAYDHTPSGYRHVEGLKNALNRRVFSKARKLVSWHEWGKKSLVRDYGVSAEKVVVIPPGIDLERWNFPRSPSTRPAGPVRLLFVGGDFRRKGGEYLLTAFRQELMRDCELDIVTREEVDTKGLANIRVHHGLGPNAPGLLALYARADIFVFPTFGDTLPIVVMEAMASGLPVVTTRVGALDEEVDDGVTGFLIPSGDADALARATRRLVGNPDLLREMSEAARRSADRSFNASKNYPRLLAVCKSAVDAG
jgi:glycosyltransferase involved in cell wall biosynthesis